MPLINENEEAGAGDFSMGSLGPRVGFLDAFETSWNQSTKAAAQYGTEYAMRNQVNEQTNSLRRAGEMNLPAIAQENMAGSFDRLTDFYAYGGDPEQGRRIQEYEDHVTQLKTKYPNLNLRTSREIWEGVKLDAQKAEEEYEKMRTTSAGAVGGFLGDTAGALYGPVNPLGALTLPVGGIGRTVVSRVASQSAAQGFISGIEQITGVQAERKKLGLSHGVGDALARTAGGAAGGAGAQAIGEVVGAGIRVATRRWFRDTPADIAPAPPPDGAGPGAMSHPARDARTPLEEYADKRIQDLIDGRIRYEDVAAPHSPLGKTRMAAARTLIDLDHVTARLDDWSGDYPGAMKPRAMTEVPDAGSSGLRFNVSDEASRAALGRFNVDEAARVADPKTFKIYDALAKQKNQLREVIERLRPDTIAEQQKVIDLNDRIDALEQQISTLDQSSRLKRVQKKVNEISNEKHNLKLQRDEALNRLDGNDTPEMSGARKELISLDAQMRDLAPVVSRAYARVRNEWNLPPDYQGAVNRMVRSGESRVSEVTPVDGEAEVRLPPQQTLQQKAPILEQSFKVEGKVGKHADAADYAQEIVKMNMEIMDEALEKQRASLAMMLKPEGENSVRLAGTDLILNLDKDMIAIPQERGSGTKMVSVREVLQDVLEKQEDLGAVTKCSI